MQKIALSGIKPTGAPHIGNYLGMIQPALQLANQYRAYYFIADCHALTTQRNPQQLAQNIREVAATWLALGLDPDKVVFYRQSDIPEIFELTWVLACSTAKGLANRAHAYKAITDANEQAGNPVDQGVNMGLFNYPILMAADILLFRAHYVPVGLDQKQHLEIARDVATTFNADYGEVFALPEPLIQQEVQTITGLDGRKMSKSYNNAIQIFAKPDELRKQVMRIVTDSRRPEEPKDPDTCNIFAIYKHFVTHEMREDTRRRYLAGGLGYGVMKQELFELLDQMFKPARERYESYLQDTGQVEQILKEGAAKARETAQTRMRQIREAIGIALQQPEVMR
jgi:tryptophanyl-tRNA synthetase